MVQTLVDLATASRPGSVRKLGGPIFAAVLVWGVGLFLQPYSTHSLRGYHEHARRLFQSALWQDSEVLERLASPSLAASVAEAARQRPDVFEAWLQNSRPYDELIAGDTTFVWFTAGGVECLKKPLMLAFAREGDHLLATGFVNTCGV